MVAETSDADAASPAKHFTVDARAMRTWGRDSIKDHTTALLELVRNSYDAGAAVVDLALQVSPVSPDDQSITIRDEGVWHVREGLQHVANGSSRTAV